MPRGLFSTVMTAELIFNSSIFFVAVSTESVGEIVATLAQNSNITKFKNHLTRLLTRKGHIFHVSGYKFEKRILPTLNSLE